MFSDLYFDAQTGLQSKASLNIANLPLDTHNQQRDLDLLAANALGFHG